MTRREQISLWIPSFTMMLVSLISYVDRNTLALLSPTILKETGMSVEQYGLIISGFSVAYSLGNPVWGRVIDVWGLRRGMTAAVGFWTLVSASHAMASGFWSFAVARVALGFGEGATFPGGLRASVQSLPVRLQSRGIALSYSGGSLGAVVTPIVVTPVALAWGWRGAFWFTGLVGLAWLVLWFFVARRHDMRTMRNAANPAEPPPPIRWRDARLWSFMAVYAMGASPLAFVLYQSAIYLNRVLGASQQQIGAVLWIPPLGWELGYFFWGWMTDRALRSGNARDAYRRLLLMNLAFSCPLAAIPWTPQSLPLTLLLFFLAMVASAGFVIVPVSYATRVFTAGHAGLIAGLGAGSWGAAVAAVMPFVGRFFDQGRYPAAFALAALLPVIGYTIWWYINREVTLEQAT